MNEIKKEQIEKIVDDYISDFADRIKTRHINELNDPEGTLNSKINNVFIASLNDDAFTFYSALCRSFDSSFGKVLENIGNEIAKISYETQTEIDSYILDAQKTKIAELKNAYDTDSEHHIDPLVEHYNTFTCIRPNNIDSYRRNYKMDHCFYNREDDEYYIIQLKAGGDLDKVKAPAEKEKLLNDYFMLKNKITDEHKNSKIYIFFGAAYNKNGEGNEWKQTFVQGSFAPEELLIGKEYWNFVCDDDEGFNTVINQYRISCNKIKQAIMDIKAAYLPQNTYSAIECEDILDYTNSMDELLDVLSKQGYDEQSSIELLSRFLEENDTKLDEDKSIEDFVKEYKDAKNNKLN